MQQPSGLPDVSTATATAAAAPTARTASDSVLSGEPSATGAYEQQPQQPAWAATASIAATPQPAVRVEQSGSAFSDPRLGSVATVVLPPPPSTPDDLAARAKQRLRKAKSELYREEVAARVLQSLPPTDWDLVKLTREDERIEKEMDAAGSAATDTQPLYQMPMQPPQAYARCFF